MLQFSKILQNLLLEGFSSKNKSLMDAIKYRNPVSFYYNGPKGEVLPGRRVKAELVAMGLTKKGNLAVRGWVEPPSTSKKGFSEHGWRLFILNRMSGMNIYEDETFDEKRPGYNEEGDRSLTTIYAKSEWGTTRPTPIEPEIPPETHAVEPERVPEPEIPVTEPQIEPETPPEGELPQPKHKEKPTTLPQPEIKRDAEVFNTLQSKIRDVNNQKIVSANDMKQGISDLYRKKMEDWAKSQQEIGGNINPGEGTRRRMEKDAEIELYNQLKSGNIKVSSAHTPLQESIIRMKALILY
jgi:hypothetical protein